MKSKQEQKLEDLQTRLADLMMTNNRLTLLNENESKENQKLLNELNVTRRTNEELQHLIDSKENHYEHMQKDHMRVNDDGIQKITELKMTNDELVSKLKSFEGETLNLRKRNGQLEEMEKERETLLKVKLQENTIQFKGELCDLEKISDERVRSTENRWEEILVEKEISWKDNVDRQEEEFRTLIFDLNNKYKTGKDQLHEKCAQIEELKVGMKATLQQNRELEDMVNQMNEALVVAKKEIDELEKVHGQYQKNEGKVTEDLRLNYKQSSSEQKRLLSQVQELKEEVSKLEEELRNKKKEISDAKRESYDLRLSLEEKEDVVRRINEKFEAYENKNLEEYHHLKIKSDESQDDLRVKNKIIEERNREQETQKHNLISKHGEMDRANQEKHEFENFSKDKMESLEMDLDKLRSKYNKKEAYLVELEEKVEEMINTNSEKERENEKLNDDLMSKGNLIDDCMEQIKQLQQNEANKNYQKDERINELEEILDKLNNKLNSKNMKLKDLEHTILAIDSANNNKLKAADDAINDLSKQLVLKDYDIERIKVEMDQQKNKAKEALQNFTNMFK